MSSTETPADSPSRRQFFSACTWFLGAIPVVGTVLVAGRVAVSGSASDRPTRIPLCRRKELPDATDLASRTVTFRARSGPAVETVAKTIFVTRDDSGQPIAMLGECTHLSCPVSKRDIAPPKDSAEGAPTSGEGDVQAPLRCPCHGGAFSRLGEVLDGPPPRPLRRLELEVPEDDDAVVHILGL